MSIYHIRSCGSLRLRYTSTPVSVFVISSQSGVYVSEYPFAVIDHTLSSVSEALASMLTIPMIDPNHASSVIVSLVLFPNSTTRGSFFWRMLIPYSSAVLVGMIDILAPESLHPFPACLRDWAPIYALCALAVLLLCPLFPTTSFTVLKDMASVGIPGGEDFSPGVHIPQTRHASDHSPSEWGYP